MIKKLNINDINIINELVNFIFVKQSTKDYKINDFPNYFYGIKYYLKKQTVYYIKEDTIKLILVFGEEEIDYLYFEDIQYLIDNLNLINNKALTINKNNILNNDLLNINENNNTYNILELNFRKKMFNDNKNKKYIIHPVNKYNLKPYLQIHSSNKYHKYCALVCIKNNEIVGYLDYKGKEILEVGGLIKKDEINQVTVKQLFFTYLKISKRKYILYETDDLKTYNYLINVGFKKIEENIKYKF